MVLILPASSIQEFSKYIKRLLSLGKKSDSVVTKLSLKKALNKTGIAFSKVNFSVVRDLNQQEKDGLGELISQIKTQSQKGADVFEEAANDEL